MTALTNHADKQRKQTDTRMLTSYLDLRLPLDGQSLHLLQYPHVRRPNNQAKSPHPMAPRPLCRSCSNHGSGFCRENRYATVAGICGAG